MKYYLLILLFLHVAYGQAKETCKQIDEVESVASTIKCVDNECTITCKENFILNGAKTVTCETNEWDNDLGICEELFCSNVESSGSQVLTGKCKLAKPGDICGITCPTGTVLKGKSSIKCQKSGYWDYDLGICEEVYCTGLKIKTNVKLPKECHFGKLGDTCEIQCTQQQKLEGVSRVTCTKNGVWSSDELGTCKDITCPSINDNCKQKKPGEICEIPCETNQRINGLSYTECTKDGIWTNELGVCEDIFCPNVESTGFGEVSGKCTLARPGEKCTLTCIANYRVKGVKSIQCKNEGLWSHDLGLCTEMKCPKLENTGHLKFLNEECDPTVALAYSKPGQKCGIKCSDDTKYKLEGANLLTCLNTEKWNRVPGVCKELFCPNIEETGGSGILSGICKMATHGHECKLTCVSGKSRVNGRDSVKCIKGKWNGDIGICEDIMCPEIKSFGTLSGQCSLAKPGGSCQIDCDKKLVLKGAKKITCLNGGYWSSDLGICEEIFCPNIENTGHGNLIGKCILARPTEHCEIQCPNDEVNKRLFRVVGRKEVICSGDGFWKGQLGICEEIMCPPPEIREGDNVELSGLCNIAKPNDKCTIKCKNGKKLVGAAELECGTNGRWKRYPGTCEDSCNIGYVQNLNGNCVGVCQLSDCHHYGAQCVAEVVREGYSGGYKCVCPPTYLPYKEGENCKIGDMVYTVKMEGIKLNSSIIENQNAYRPRRSLYAPRNYVESEEEELRKLNQKIKDATEKIVKEAFKLNFKNLTDVKVEDCSHKNGRDTGIILVTCLVEMFYPISTEEPDDVKDIKRWENKTEGYLLLKPELEVQKEVVEKLTAAPVENPCDQNINVCMPENECKKDEKSLSYSCPCKQGYEPMKNVPHFTISYESPFCKDINECELGKNNSCTENQKCVNDFGGYHCECEPGYKNVSGVCIGICEDNPCKNRGSCRLSADHINFVCECPLGFSGAYCDIRVEKLKSEKLNSAEMNNVIVGSVLGGLLLLSIGGSAFVIGRLRKKNTKVEHYEDVMQPYKIQRPELRTKF